MYPIFNPNTIDVGGSMNITNSTSPGFWESLFKKWSRSGLTGAELEQNKFNARQAEVARDWQERMYTQYQSPEAMMRQYKDAGLNPSLLYKGASSGSIPSASLGPSGSPLQATSSGLVDTLLSLVRFRSEVDNINADTAQKRSVTTSQDIQNYIANMTKEVSISQAESNLSLTDNQVNKLALEMSELEFNVSTQQLRKALLEADKVFKTSQIVSLNVKTAIDKLNNKFQADVFGIPIPILAGLAVGGSNIISTLIKKFSPRGKGLVTNNN